MKLFVWHKDVLSDWTSGQITVLASDIDDARDAIIRSDPNLSIYMSGIGEPGDIGEPDDIVDLGPCLGVEARAWITYGGG